MMINGKRFHKSDLSMENDKIHLINSKLFNKFGEFNNDFNKKRIVKMKQKSLKCS